MGRNGVTHRTWPLRTLREHLRDDRLNRSPAERRFAGQHLVKHRAERVHVGALVDVLLSHGLLGCHVLRSSEGEARLRHARLARVMHGERDAKVGDDGAAVLQEHVLRLDVAMYDAVAVRVVERAGHLGRDSERLGNCELLFRVEPVAKSVALDERHHVEEQAIRGAAVEQRQDVRMLQRRRRLDLSEEAVAADHRGEIRVKDLDRDGTIVLQVVRGVDGRHAALPELALDAVAAFERLRQAQLGVGRAGHRGGGQRQTTSSTAAQRAMPKTLADRS